MGGMLTPLNLTDLERKFVFALVRGAEKTAAAVTAGYSPSDADNAANDLVRKPNVAAAIEMELRRELVTDAPNSLRVLREIRDSEAAPGTRAMAANSLLDRAGIVAPRDIATPARELDSCTIEELHALVDQLASKRGDQAKDVSRGLLQHDSTAAPSNDADIFD